MSFTYSINIPNANNYPGDDQPGMQQNYQSISQLIDVDHVGFNTVGGGQHKQITFNSKNVPGAQTDPQSTLYTNSGTASTVSQLLYRNQDAILPVSALRAFGSFANGALGPIVPLNQYNVVSIANTASSVAFQTYTINLVANCTTGNNVCVQITVDDSQVNPLVSIKPFTYSFTGGVLTIVYTAAPAFSGIINFAIYQF